MRDSHPGGRSASPGRKQPGARGSLWPCGASGGHLLSPAGTRPAALRAPGTSAAPIYELRPAQPRARRPARLPASPHPGKEPSSAPRRCARRLQCPTPSSLLGGYRPQCPGGDPRTWGSGPGDGQAAWGRARSGRPLHRRGDCGPPTGSRLAPSPAGTWNGVPKRPPHGTH